VHGHRPGKFTSLLISLDVLAPYKASFTQTGSIHKLLLQTYMVLLRGIKDQGSFHDAVRQSQKKQASAYCSLEMVCHGNQLTLHGDCHYFFEVQ